MIRIVEGFDHYNNTTELLRKGWSNSLMYQGTLGFASGRFSGQSLSLGRGGTGDPGTNYVRKSLYSNEDTVYAGIAIYVPASAMYDQGFGFSDGATDQITVKISASRQVVVLRGGVGGTIITTALKVYPEASWIHLSAQFTIHNTDGIIKVWANGELIIDLASQNTRATSNNYVNRVFITVTSGATDSSFFDDFYSGDDTGAINTVCPTEARIYTLYPTSSGTYNEWSYSGTSYAWQAVDDSVPDNDSTYIYSNVSGTRSTFTFGDLEADADSVYAIQFVNYGRKDDADVRTTKFLMGVPAGTLYEFGTGSFMGSNYQYFTFIQETDPITAGELTPTIVNDNEYGIVVSM